MTLDILFENGSQLSIPHTSSLWATDNFPGQIVVWDGAQGDHYREIEGVTDVHITWEPSAESTLSQADGYRDEVEAEYRYKLRTEGFDAD